MFYSFEHIIITTRQVLSGKRIKLALYISPVVIVNLVLLLMAIKHFSIIPIVALVIINSVADYMFRLAIINMYYADDTEFMLPQSWNIHLYLKTFVIKLRKFVIVALVSLVVFGMFYVFGSILFGYSSEYIKNLNDTYYIKLFNGWEPKYILSDFLADSKGLIIYYIIALIVTRLLVRFISNQYQFADFICYDLIAEPKVSLHEIIHRSSAILETYEYDLYKLQLFYDVISLSIIPTLGLSALLIYPSKVMSLICFYEFVNSVDTGDFDIDTYIAENPYDYLSNEEVINEKL